MMDYKAYNKVNGTNYYGNNELARGLDLEHQIHRLRAELADSSKPRRKRKKSKPTAERGQG
jgi:hypothetical protein